MPATQWTARSFDQPVSSYLCSELAVFAQVIKQIGLGRQARESLFHDIVYRGVLWPGCQAVRRFGGQLWLWDGHAATLGVTFFATVRKESEMTRQHKQ